MVHCLCCLILYKALLASFVGQEILVVCFRYVLCADMLQHSFHLYGATDRSKEQNIELTNLVGEISICSLELASTTDELRQVHERPTSITSDAS